MAFVVIYFSCDKSFDVLHTDSRLVKIIDPETAMCKYRGWYQGKIIGYAGKKYKIVEFLPIDALRFQINSYYQTKTQISEYGTNLSK